MNALRCQVSFLFSHSDIEWAMACVEINMAFELSSPHKVYMDIARDPLVSARWHDLAWPVLTFQRGKALSRVIRVPMWEQLDGAWSRKAPAFRLE